MSQTLSNNRQRLEIMKAWLAAANGWATGTIGVDIALFTNNYVPAPDDTASSYVAASITGASAVQSVTSSAVLVFADGTVAITNYDVPPFTPLAEPDPPVTAYGYFVKGHSNGLLLAARRFDDAVPLHDGESIILDVFAPAPLVWQFPDPTLP